MGSRPVVDKYLVPFCSCDPVGIRYADIREPYYFDNYFEGSGNILRGMTWLSGRNLSGEFVLIRENGPHITELEKETFLSFVEKIKHSNEFDDKMETLLNEEATEQG